MSDERNGRLGAKWKPASTGSDAQTLHPSWRAFITFCEQMQHGEVERVRIQDGLPVLAEVTRTKVKFTA